MAVRDFELFHGAVLTKLVRGDRPLTLRLIETRPTDSWSTYRLNDEVNLLMKHSTVSSARKREPGAVVWQFVFSPDQMKQVAKTGVWVALVCGAPVLTKTDMDVCLLEPSQLAALLALDRPGQPQSITVKRQPNMSLRVTSAKTPEEVIVPRNRLDTWRVPGS
jgi:hypothetical protein